MKKQIGMVRVILAAVCGTGWVQAALGSLKRERECEIMSTRKERAR